MDRPDELYLYTGGDAGDPCQFCRHHLGSHNSMQGCTGCPCLATPGEARPSIDADGNFMIVGMTPATALYMPTAAQRRGAAVTKQEDRPNPTGRKVASIHVPLKAEHMVELVKALERAVGETLYVRSGLEFWAHGEVLEQP